MSSEELAKKSCIPCQAGAPPMTGEDAAKLLSELGHGWAVVDNHHLEKEYRFKNFREAMAFAVRVGLVAEGQGHHPDLFLAWGKLKVVVWTHKIDGLTESDFVFAAKVEREMAPL